MKIFISETICFWIHYLLGQESVNQGNTITLRAAYYKKTAPIVMLISEKILRSAMASKLAYAKTNIKVAAMPHTAQLHGSRGVRTIRTNPDGDMKEDEVWFIDDTRTGIHAYAWKNGTNSTVIAFKGSSTTSDVLNLADVRLNNFHFRDKKVKVHSGVLRMFHSIEDVLNKQILDSLTLRTRKYVTFCGHSLGGAIAIFAAAYYGNISHNNIGISCHTFGAPKVGDTEFVRWLNEGAEDIVNVVTEGDLVPQFPLLGYDSNEVKTVIMKDTKKIHNPFQQHDLETYIESLRKYSELQKAPNNQRTSS